MDKLTGTKRKYRRGEFAVDGGGNWYFREAENGCWIEIDVAYHSACAYVCVMMEDGDVPEFGDAIASRILRDPEDL